MTSLNPGHSIRTIVIATLTCAALSPVWAGTLQGTAFYRERIALPANAVFEAQLQDSSRADAPAIILGRATLDPAGNTPFNFEISFDESSLEPGHRYTVRASVVHEGRLLFTSDKNYTVLTDRTIPLNIKLISVTKENPLHSDSAPSDLRGTYWKLIRLGDKDVQLAEKQREPNLVFANDELRVSGFSGCNRIMGGFEIDGDTLHFSQMAGTMMACVNGMELEHQFLQTLTETERYSIQGNHLQMFDASGARIAEFEAVWLR